MEMDEKVLRILDEKGEATADEISAEIKIPILEVKKVLARLETAGLLLLLV